MKKIGMSLMTGVVTIMLTPLLMWGAGVELRPGTTVEFASVEQGRQILAERDIGRFSQFDCCVRMRTSAPVTQAQYWAYMTNQVRAWTSAEISQLTGMLHWLGNQIRDLNLDLPGRFYLVKTTGNEEGNAAYTLGTDVVLPQVAVSGDANQLRKILAHELFHVYLTYNPEMRGALYHIIGFRLCREIPLPQWLVDRRITSTGPDLWNFVIQVKVEEERVPALLVFYSRSTNYTSGQLFDYLVSQLLVLEATSEGYRASCLPDGTPRLVDVAADPPQVTDYFDQIGGNTAYRIHPEEILAENFTYIVGHSNYVYSPRIPYQLKNTIVNPSLAAFPFPAGRFWSELRVHAAGDYAIEASTDLWHWSLCAYRTNAGPVLEWIDPEVWLCERRFFRATAASHPPLIPGDTNQMVWIPPGTFLMGSPSSEVGRWTDEGPQTEVTLTRGFLMARYLVTQEEYAAVMGSNPSDYHGFPNLPVENVTFPQASNYCVLLTEQERAAGRLPSGLAYRLPTEAEREYAVRARTTTRFYFGDDPDQIQIYLHAWFWDNASTSGFHTRSVGLKRPNPWGLYDMEGNVGEFCTDWYGAYPGGRVTDPAGPATGTYRVVRGGSYDCPPTACRSASRGRQRPDYAFHSIGFRLVLAAERP